MIEVAKSWNPPHRVIAQGHNKFYVRNSAGKHEADMSELRVLFSNTATTNDRVRTYARERVGRISVNDGIREMADHGEETLGTMVMQLIPLSAFVTVPMLQVTDLHERRNLFRDESIGGPCTINIEGICLHVDEHKSQKARVYPQAYRTGVVETVRLGVVVNQPNRGGLLVPSLAIERHIIRPAHQYLQALVALGLSCPIICRVDMLGMQDSALAFENAWGLIDNQRYLRDLLTLTEVQFMEYPASLEETATQLAPLIHSMWNAFGITRSQNFDENERWVPK